MGEAPDDLHPISYEMTTEGCTATFEKMPDGESWYVAINSGDPLGRSASREVSDLEEGRSWALVVIPKLAEAKRLDAAAARLRDEALVVVARDLP